LAVHIFTGTDTVALPEGICEELAVRLVDFGAPDAAERLLRDHSIRTEDKPVVREVLGRLLRSARFTEFELELMQLQQRLGRDLDHRWRAFQR